MEVALVISVQAGLAAALAWWIGHRVLGNPSPVFAPSAAVGTIVAALGQRARRTFELLIGVGLGIAASDFLLAVLGHGFWQVGVIVPAPSSLRSSSSVAVGRPLGRLAARRYCWQPLVRFRRTSNCLG
ncbi:FUSC family protein [Micromonospora chersina]|uniref:FUSC family protein n=1 Tax=Micromonospora chersina TaxID=47854 RepID=UPI0033E16386